MIKIFISILMIYVCKFLKIILRLVTMRTMTVTTLTTTIIIMIIIVNTGKEM